MERLAGLEPQERGRYLAALDGPPGSGCRPAANQAVRGLRKRLEEPLRASLDDLRAMIAAHPDAVAADGDGAAVSPRPGSRSRIDEDHPASDRDRRGTRGAPARRGSVRVRWLQAERSWPWRPPAASRPMTTRFDASARRSNAASSRTTPRPSPRSGAPSIRRKTSWPTFRLPEPSALAVKRPSAVASCPDLEDGRAVDRARRRADRSRRRRRTATATPAASRSTVSTTNGRGSAP